MILLLIFQLEEQKFEMDKLRRELEEKMGEIQQIKGILKTCEKVFMIKMWTELSDVMNECLDVYFYQPL